MFIVALVKLKLNYAPSFIAILLQTKKFDPRYSSVHDRLAKIVSILHYEDVLGISLYLCSILCTPVYTNSIVSFDFLKRMFPAVLTYKQLSQGNRIKYYHAVYFSRLRRCDSNDDGSAMATMGIIFCPITPRCLCNAEVYWLLCAM